MRAAERIHIIVFSFFVSLAWVRALPRRRRAKVTVIGVAGLGVTLAAFLLPRFLPLRPSTIVRDWLPAALVLLVYWQAGEFFVKVDQRLQDRLAYIDERVVPPLRNWLSRHRAGRWTAAFLELSYLLCYPMIPMSLGALYLMRLARYADAFWTVVLISTYLSYAALPFLQTLPPRMLPEPWLEPLPASAVRKFNLWILRHASIHVNTFPSAHVAASCAAAFVLTVVAPWPVGLVSLILAAGIAVGTFAGRYHFAGDAAAGIAVAVVVFLAAALLGYS